jgi:hypothetical protein
MTDKDWVLIYYLQKMKAEHKRIIAYFNSYSVERAIMQQYHERDSYNKEKEYFASYLPELYAIPFWKGRKGCHN